ncbi:cell division protein FtsA [Pilibacter termitis]|uniref:Cell division protein FtsA n=1 Tax=Pilibacter termitis TaxID=263852 RepID=A0A1T4M4P1_9ENTE|nr:cell division protein FtsA [Pilibacter termitis]SJZ61979.1 cell division protein FtsA [Pilibacter termitis]
MDKTKTKTGLYAALDIGTTSIKVVVAEYVDGQMNVIGVGNAKSEGLKKGFIINIDKAVESIKRAVSQAEEKAGIQIRNVNVGIPANQLDVEVCQGMIAIHAQAKEITDEDVHNVASAALVRAILPERQIISVVPQNFVVDGFDSIQDPRGMIGVRLEMTGLLYTGPKTIIHNIQSAVEKAGLVIDDFVVLPLALGENILGEGQSSFGTVVVDLGGGQTTTSVFSNGELHLTFVDPEGGENVTGDISNYLKTSQKNAEALKINYGLADSTRASEYEKFPVDVIGQAEPVEVDEHYLSQIIEARYAQIFQNSREFLANHDALDLQGGIVLTGGASSVPSVKDLASEVYGNNVPVEQYVPNQMGLRNPVFSNVIAIAEYAAGLDEIYGIAKGAIYGGEYMPSRMPEVPQQSSGFFGGKTQELPPMQQVEMQKPDYEDDYYYDDEPKAKGKGKGILGKARGLINEMFD